MRTDENELMFIATVGGVVTALSALAAFFGWHDTWAHLLYLSGAVTLFVSITALLIKRCDDE